MENNMGKASAFSVTETDNKGSLLMGEFLARRSLLISLEPAILAISRMVGKTELAYKSGKTV